MKLKSTSKRTSTLKATESAASKKIVRESVCIDLNVVNTACVHLNNQAVYTVFKSNEQPPFAPEKFDNIRKGKMTSYVCFSGLLDMISKKKPNKIYDRVKLLSAEEAGAQAEFILSPNEISNWITFAKEHKLLPPYIDENAVVGEEGDFILDLTGLSPAMLYVYLATLRNIREDPGFPRAVMYLVDKIGMNFFAAYIFASKMVVSSTGHHIISVQRPYGLIKSVYDKKSGTYVPNKINMDQVNDVLTMDLNIAIGLQRFINSDPLRYDTRDLKTYNINLKNAYGFKCSDTINSISNVMLEVSFQDLLDSDIIAAIMSENDKEAQEYVKKFTAKKPNIKYVGAKK